MEENESQFSQETNKIGQILLDEDRIINDQLQMALEFQKKIGGKLGNILVKLGFITEEELMQALASQQNMEFIDLKNLVLPEELIKTVPRQMIEKHEAIPVRLQEEENILTLATHDQKDIEAIEEIQLATDYKIETILAPRATILKVINHFFYSDDQDVQEFRLALEEEKQKEQNTSFTMSSLVIALLKTLEEKDIVQQKEVLNTLAQWKNQS